MADMDNFSEINQNFDTIKTLLNSIRAQGILNTSDVDKLLSGINSKLEKINTEEDIDLIKIFLSELKQNLDERHNVLVSKFGAIESLFSNLLKNSTEMPKSADIKELFDIVATNLSVFSREVVSQKDTLTDITLRLDALRSDDSQKKDIIKNITLLKPDLERLNNGFDSIVLSLNDNFKTIIKTITTIDKTEYLDKFSDNLNSIEMSSNTVLSALQMLDKKTEQVEDALHNLATKEDVISTGQRLFDLTAQSHELKAVVSDLSDKYIRIDNLADKIDASVNIIASLKTVLEDAEDKSTTSILEQLRGLEAQLQTVSSDTKFEEFKASMEAVLKSIANNSSLLDKSLLTSSQDVQRIVAMIEALDIKVNFQNVISALDKLESDVKSSISEVSQRLSTLQDANITRVLNEISAGAENLGSKLTQTQSEIAILCEKNFGSVFENVVDLKNLISQIEDNSVSANNAIFSSITDRLTIFENSLKNSLDLQEKTVNHASAQLVEQIENIKNLSSVLDYKMDSSVVEVANIKREFSTLQSAVEKVLALDFVNVVKDLRVDLYASKQEMVNSFEATNADLSEKLTNDLYGKYELLISKLDSVEDEFKKAQSLTLVDLKQSLEKISGSIVDVLTYVSERGTTSTEGIDEKITGIIDAVKENNLNYIESVRDVVDIIRIQVENNLKSFDEENAKSLDALKNVIHDNSDDIKKEIKYSYSKLLEIQDVNNEIKDLLNVNNLNSGEKINKILASAEGVKSDFENKLISLKNTLLDKITDFKQEFTCENADKISELKFSVETLYSKNAQEVYTCLENLREQIKTLSTEDYNSRTATLGQILDNFGAVKELIKSLNDRAADNLTAKVDFILDDFANVKGILDKVDETIDEDLTRQLSIIESNFESLVSQMTILFDKSDKSLSDKINSEFNSVSEKMQEVVSEKLETYKLKIEETFEELSSKTLEQSKYLQEKIVDLNSSLKVAWEKQTEINAQQIEDVALNLRTILDENIKLTAVDYVALKNKLGEFAKNIESNNVNLTQDIKSQLDDIAKYIDSILNLQAEEFALKQDDLKTCLIENSSKNIETLESVKNLVSEQLNLANSASADLSALSQMTASNNNLIESLDTLAREQHTESIAKDEIVLATVKNIELATASTSSDVIQLKSELASLLQSVLNSKELVGNLEKTLVDNMTSLTTLTAEISAGELQTLGSYIERISGQLDAQKQQIVLCKDMLVDFSKKELDLISKNIEKETDVIIAELIEQFDLLKKSQADDAVNLISQLEEIINAHIYNNIEDLKSYLDIKTDNSVLSSKLDNLKIEMSSSVEGIVASLNKLLSTELFTTSMADYRAANELIVNVAVDRINSEISSFIAENGKDFEEKLNLFDKKFVDTVVDKYEEIKLIVNKYNESFEGVQEYLAKILVSFDETKTFISSKIDSLASVIKDSADSMNKEIGLLNECFENLRSQISNKSFDEAFQASINKQIASLESLITEQLGYIEDINDLCVNNLPDVSELNTLVKHSILESINKFSDKLDSYNVKEDIELVRSDVIDSLNESLNSLDIEKYLSEMKSDIITQFLNVFNQISFIAEQEEILDFIQEKHDDLITILSHIVTTSSEVGLVRDNLVVVDTKIDSLKEEICLLNEKINAIISSDDHIDYVYSLQELESDIANLRLVLNELKESNQSKEFENLINSTNEVYNLVESVKSELPTKNDIEALSEDIVSISTRTNKLILASDESYKTLQDNLQEFKLVINDLDERTRNFAQESGMDRINTKLNAINTMMQNGAKTNQVFNQIFEYLAEWVDNASVQINTISDKVETLDDIGQIKLMLADLKAGAEDNSESIELIEALGAVFDKQAKKISSLEAKLDRIIVENTINKSNNLDITPIENTLNRFLVTMDEKLSSQQTKIETLETKLETVLGLLDEKDTAVLSKKVGGMDRQIAKLNKSIEKIASHVVEK